LAGSKSWRELAIEVKAAELRAEAEQIVDLSAPEAFIVSTMAKHQLAVSEPELGTQLLAVLPKRMGSNASTLPTRFCGQSSCTMPMADT